MSDSWTLVTGANGFIGARLVRHLVERGERVKAFVRAGANLTQLSDLPSNQVRIAMGDVTCAHTVYRALAGCDRLYHLAANFSLWARHPAREITGPIVNGTEAVLEAARRRSLKRVVYTASAAGLGVSREPQELTEADHAESAAFETYYSAKCDAEQIALEQAKSGVPIVIVNPTVVAGPGDWKPTPPGRMLVRYLEWSTFAKFRVPERGGFNLVDVDDVAQGHRLAMEKGRLGERYILGGENVETRTLFSEIIPEVTGYAPQITTTNQGGAMMAARVLELGARLSGKPPDITCKLVEHHMFNYVFTSSSKAERELGYSHRPLRETIGRAVRWFRQHGHISPAAARRIARAA